MSWERADALWSELEQAHEDWWRLSEEFWALGEEHGWLFIHFLAKERRLFERMYDARIQAIEIAPRYRVAQFNARPNMGLNGEEK